MGGWEVDGAIALRRDLSGVLGAQDKSSHSRVDVPRHAFCLREVKVSFLAAHATKPARQVHIENRTIVEPWALQYSTAAAAGVPALVCLKSTQLVSCHAIRGVNLFSARRPLLTMWWWPFQCYCTMMVVASGFAYQAVIARNAQQCRGREAQ